MVIGILPQAVVVPDAEAMEAVMGVRVVAVAAAVVAAAEGTKQKNRFTYVKRFYGIIVKYV